MVQNRSVGMAIVLTIVTCGIYGIYWLYCMLTDLYFLTGQENKAGMDIVLSVITCGIFFIYLMYKMGIMINQAKIARGMYPDDQSIMFIVLSLFGFAIIVYAIVQDKLNKDFSAPMGGPGPMNGNGQQY